MILGTNEFSVATGIFVYPNPSDEIIHIKVPVSVKIETVKIYNVLGQLVQEQDFSESIDISKLSEGMHFIYFETNYGSIHKTLIKR